MLEAAKCGETDIMDYLLETVPSLNMRNQVLFSLFFKLLIL